MTNASYAKLTAGLIVAWFAFSFTASALQVFNTNPNRPPLPLLLSVLIPIGLFSLWYRSSKSFREFVLSLNPRTLTSVQSWRIAGYVFLVLEAYRILPGAFALPAGWGDIVIGLTSLLAAAWLATPTHRTAFIAWQLLGMTDLVLAVTLGGAGRFLDPQAFGVAGGATTAPMTTLPLSLIPTFGVPLFFILHVICIAQALRWPSRVTGRVGELHTAAM